MQSWMRVAAIGLACAAIAAMACGGGGGSKTETPTPGASPTAGAAATARPATAGATTTGDAGATVSAGTASTPASGSGAAETTAPPPPPPPPPPAAAGKTYSAAEGAAQVNAGTLTPADLLAGWKIQSDMTTDNAAAAAADPANAASIERCGRLTGRTLTNFPADSVASFLAGDTLAFFTSATSYATVAGATDCSLEAAVRLQQPGQLARAFGSVFVNPDAVIVSPYTYPQVADGSFAATLTGQVNAAGTTIDLTILIVAFRKGNVTDVVGSARSGQTPPADELTPLINLVIGRIAAAQ